MLRIGPRTRNLLLGTATPIQTEVHELWDLMRSECGHGFCLGPRSRQDLWVNLRRALPVVKATKFRRRARRLGMAAQPMPGEEEPLVANLRLQLGIPDHAFFTDKGFGSLEFFAQQSILQTLSPGFYQQHNSIVRHTVLRRRKTLEEAGLLERVAVEVHPCPTLHDRLPGCILAGSACSRTTRSTWPTGGRRFHYRLQQRTRAAGFMKSLLLQRICSSFASGRAARPGCWARLLEDEEEAALLLEPLGSLTPSEAGHLGTIVELSRPERTTQNSPPSAA